MGTTDSLQPRSRIDRYELLCHVAEGGMGTVWVARQVGKHGFERLVAFKTVRPEALSDTTSGFDFRKMFLDEVKIASRIEHPNVAQVVDVGEERGLLFMVMELVDGESLSALIHAVQSMGRPIPFGISLRIVADVCTGLHAAHELRDKSGALLNVVHRDVSPQNILITRNGVTKLIDFGVAKARGRSAEATNTGSLKGKLRYMPPEQARGEDVDRRADVYSVGAVLYRLVKGEPPVDGTNEAAMLKSLLSGQRPPPLPDAVPAKLRATIEKALAFAPAERFSTANEMRLALEDAMATHRLGATPGDVASFLSDHLAHRLDARKEAIDMARRMADESAAQSEERTPRKKNETLAWGVAPNASDVPKAPPVPQLDLAPQAVEPPPPKKPPPPKPDAPEPKLELAPKPKPAEAPKRERLQPKALPEAPSAAAQLPHPAAVDDGAGPGFMDVGALLRKAQGAPELDVPKKPARAPEPSRPDEPEPKIELAVVRKPKQPPPPAKPLRWKRPAAVAGVLLALAAIAFLVLPYYAKSRIVRAASERGLTVAIDRVSISFSSIELTGIVVTSPEIPSVKVACKEMSLTSPLSPQQLQVRGLEVAIAGTMDEVASQIEAWHAHHRSAPGGGGSTGSPLAIKTTLAKGHVVWQKAFGQGFDLELSDVSGELGSAGLLGDDVKIDSRHVDFSTPRGHLGPWGLNVERDAKATRTRLELDPIVPDGPVALLVTGQGLTPRLTVKVARTPLIRIGVPPAALGLETPPEIELTADGTMTGPRLDTTFALALYGVKVGTGQPIDMKIKGGLSGDPTKPLDLKNAQLEMGPFTAHASGTVTPNPTGGYRADLAWRADPIPCDLLAKRTAQGAAALGLQVAQAFGIAKVVGTASASGLISFDSQAPEKAAFTMTSSDTCGLSIFPGK